MPNQFTAKHYMIIIGASCFLLCMFFLGKQLIPYLFGETVYAIITDVKQMAGSKNLERHSVQETIVYFEYKYGNREFYNSWHSSQPRSAYAKGDTINISVLHAAPSQPVILQDFGFLNILLTIGAMVSFMIAFGLYKWG